MSSELFRVQAVTQVERFVRERRDTDQPLISWALYFFLLSWITIGIYSIYIFYKRLDRADRYRQRKLSYHRSVIQFAGQYAEQTGRMDEVHGPLGDVDNYLRERFEQEHKPLNAGLSTVLAVVTLGIYGLVQVYRLMRFWWEIQITEQEFDDRISQTLLRLGVINYPVSYATIPKLRRSFGVSLLLSVVTFGIYGIVWDYQLHTDPDMVFPESRSSEDTILNALRSASA